MSSDTFLGWTHDKPDADLESLIDRIDAKQDGLGVIVCSGAGDGHTDDRGTIASDAVTPTATGAALSFKYGTYRVGSDLTIGCDVTFATGAMLKPAAGVTITLSKTITAGLQQIFDLSAGGSVELAPGVAPTVPPQWFGAVGDRVADDTIAIQAWIDACSSDTIWNLPQGYAPAGGYRMTSGLTFKKQFVRLSGAGMMQTELFFDGVTTSYVSTAVMPYLRPFLSDFSITSNVGATGKGIDLSNITTIVYQGEIRNIWIFSTGDAFYAPLFSSMLMQNVSVSSSAGHGFRVDCDVGVLWSYCYAVLCGPNKAGFRLCGLINMQSCNGLTGGDYWGVFGNDTTSADGFQDDFPGVTDYPLISCNNCNVEHFGKGGIRVQQGFYQFDFVGKLDRSDLATAYDSIIRIRVQSVGSIAARVHARVFVGSGVPNGGIGLTQGWFIGSAAYFHDASGTLAGDGVTVFYDSASGIYRPFLTQETVQDIFSETAWAFNAIMPRRITQRVLRYDTLVLTPAGASAQTVDVTGYTKLKITPSGAYSIDKATFNQAVGVGSDALRNGELIIEAGNTNLTLNHNVIGEGGFRLTGGANLTLAAGQIVRFLWSDNYRTGPIAGWVQT